VLSCNGVGEVASGLTLAIPRAEPAVQLNRSGTTDRFWPKAEKPLRRNISSGHWGAADAICSL
jgi:hypothetical protein